MTQYIRSDMKERFTGQMNDKHTKVMIITQVQHKLEVASHIERDSQPYMVAYDHLFVPRIPVLSTYSIITGEQNMTVIIFCHVSWFYIPLI